MVLSAQFDISSKMAARMTAPNPPVEIAYRTTLHFSFMEK